MFFDRQASPSHRQIQRAIAGEASLGDLDENERVVANAAINAASSTAANEVSFADRLAARGVTTVVMDDEGRMVRRHPARSSIRQCRRDRRRALARGSAVPRVRSGAGRRDCP